MTRPARRTRRFATALSTVLAAVLLAACGSAAAGPDQPTASGTTTSNPDQATVGQIAVTPTDLGSGWTVNAPNGSDSVVGEVTLDVCGKGVTFPSEALRTARHQIWFFPPGSSQPAASNEVVAYRPGGAQQARQELLHAVTACPHRPVPGLVANEPTATYTVDVITSQKTWQPNTVALRIRGVATTGETVTEVTIYQFRGRFMSAVYGSASSTGTPTADEVKAADAASRHLATLPAS